MTKDEEFEAIMDVFTHPGWKLILEDIDKAYQTMDSVRDIQSNEQFWEVKGGCKQLNWFLRLEDWYQFAQDNQDAEV